MDSSVDSTLTAVSVLSTVINFAICIIRSVIAATAHTSPPKIADNIIIVVATFTGFTATMLTSLTVAWQKQGNEEANTTYYCAQWLFLLSILSSRMSMHVNWWAPRPRGTRNLCCLLVMAAFTMSTAALGYIAMFQCSKFVGDEWRVCWSYESSKDIEYWQNLTEFTSITITLLSIICMDFCNGYTFSLSILNISMTYFIYWFIKEERTLIYHGELNREIHLMILLVLYQNLTFITVNITPIISALRYRRPTARRNNNIEIELQDMPPLIETESRHGIDIVN